MTTLLDKAGVDDQAGLMRDESAESKLIDLLESSAFTMLSRLAFLERVELQVDACEHINAIDSHRGISAMHAAATFVREPELAGPIIEMLMRYGASLHAFDVTGHVPLHSAVLASNIAAVDAFLRVGANVNEMASDGVTNPLDLACEALRYPNTETTPPQCCMVVEVLAGAGAVATASPHADRPHCLTFAAGGNDHGVQGDFAAVVELVIGAGADVDVRESGTGRTPLHYASMRGYANTAAVLLRCGADVQAIDDRGLLPSDYADQFAAASHQTRAVLRAAEMQRLIFDL